MKNAGAKLYECDPQKNKECKKTICGTLCKHTTNPNYAKKCAYCDNPGQYLAVVDCPTAFSEARIFLNVSGGYLQIFDENYPGMSESIAINNCPMCGRLLK